MPQLPRSVSSLPAAFFMAGSSAANLFGYEVMRSCSNSLFNASFGVDKLPLALTLIPLVLLPILFLYNRSLERFGPKNTYLLTNILFALTLLGCIAGLKMGWYFASGILYVFRETYIVLVVEQAWSFINSQMNKDDARRYSGKIMTLSSCGAILGGLSVHQFAESFGTTTLLFIPALMAVPGILFGAMAYQRGNTEFDRQPHRPRSENSSLASSLGLESFKNHRVLHLILFLVLISQVYSTLVTLNFQFFLAAAQLSMDQQSSISGLIFSLLYVVSLTFQFVVSPRLMKKLSLQHIHVMIPLVHASAIAATILYPSITTAACALILFKSLDYSIFRAAKEILYIPLPFDAQFRAKEFIDVFGNRGSKSVASFLLSLYQQAGFTLTSSLLLWLNIAVTSSWIFIASPWNKAMASTKEMDGGIIP